MIHEIPPMAWKWCSLKHSLHMAVAIQILKWEITIAIHTNHGKCNVKLQIWDLLNEYDKYYELILLYGCPTSAETVILSMSCAPGTVWNCHWVHMLTWWAKNVTLHSSVLPGLPQGILGSPLSCIGLLSPPRMVSWFLLRQVSWNTDPSRMVSFMNWCLCFLHGRCPSQTGVCDFFREWSNPDKSLSIQVLLGPINKLCLDVPWYFSGQSPSSPCDDIHQNLVTGCPLLCSQVDGWFPKSWPITGNISAKACSFAVNIWSWTLGSKPLDTGTVAV